MTVAIDKYVARLLAEAPPPSTEQLQIIRGLIGPQLQAARPTPRCRPRPTRPRPPRKPAAQIERNPDE
jgi:hypothetical protein